MAERLREHFRCRALLLAAILALAGGLTFDPKLYINGDNVDYILLAQKVLHEGSLWASRKFPPFFPMLLAPVQLFSGTAWIPQKILVSLLFVASGPLLLRLSERILPARLALPAVALGMISIPVLEFSHYVMSEVPFLFLFLAALVVGEQPLRKPEGESPPRTRAGPLPWGPLVLFFALSACAFYTRTVGAILPVAFLLIALSRRRPRLFLAGAGLSVLLLLPWILHTYFSKAEGSTYLAQVLWVNPYYPEEGLLTPAKLLHRLAYNARSYFMVDIPRLLVPFGFETTYMPRAVWHHAWPALLWVLPLGVLFAGLFVHRARLPLVFASLLLNLAVCLLWPPIWTSVRFIIPIVPLLIVFFIAGGYEIAAAGRTHLGRPRTVRPPAGTRKPPGTRAGWAARVAGPAGLPFILFLAALAGIGARNLYLYGLETRHYPPPWAFYFEAAEWAGKHLPRGSVVVDRKPAMFELVSGLPTVGFPREAHPDSMLAYFRRAGVDYVHASSIPYDDISRYLIPAIRARSGHFASEWHSDNVGGAMSALFAFEPEGRWAESPAPAAEAPEDPGARSGEPPPEAGK